MTMAVARHIHHRPRREPGQIVWARIRGRKMRPGVLIGRISGGWRVAGLTTRAVCRDGSTRLPIPHPVAVGLESSGFVWGGPPAGVAYRDIARGAHLGWADAGLVEALISRCDLSDDDIEALHRGARRQASLARVAALAGAL
jgi:hypothetical protein